MAISPTFSTSNQYIKYRIIVTENSQSIANNTTNITVTVSVWRTNTGYTSYGSGTCYCGINGTTYSASITPSQKFTYNSYTQVFSKTLNIGHNADGSKTIWVSSLINHSVFSSSDQGFNVTLTKIPRYATSTQSLSSKTETTITMLWRSDSTIDYIWYSSNNGSSWTGVNVADGTSGSYTISGLRANTSYNVKTRVRRKDSQLTTDSSALSVTTYNYPYATTSNNFIIGDGAEIGIYNPLGRSYTCTIYGADNSAMGSYTGTYTGTLNAEFKTAAAIDAQYKSIPNAKSGTYTVKVVYGSNTATRTGGTYTINSSECTPSIDTVSYADTNSTTTTITGNNQQIIQTHSIVRYTASSLTAKKYASISSCKVSVNNNNYTLSISGSTATGGNATINSASNVTATFTVTDSRGLTASKNITVNMLEWSVPSAIITLQRQNNFYSETDINVNADYASLNNKNSVTLKYRYKKTTASTYGSYYTLSDGITSTFTIDNNYDWNVQVLVTDKLGSTTYNLQVARGTPIIYFDRLKSSTGFNCFPQDEKSVEVNGVNISRNAMTRSLSAALTNLATNTYTIVPLDLYIGTGDKLTSTSDYGIKIGSNINAVMVSAQLGFNANPSNGSRHIRIMKNSYNNNNTIGWSYNYITQGCPEVLVIPPILAAVTAGDIIYLWYYTIDSSDTIGGNTYGCRTSLTVETVG